MKARTLALAVSLWVVGCAGDDAFETGEAALCGDLDGEGGDTGNIPNVLGRWTTSFATTWFDESCNLGGLDQSSEAWLTGALSIEGYVPDGLASTFSAEEDVVYRGMVSRGGGMVMTGVRDSQFGTMYVSINGLVYEDPYLERDVWKGSVYIGVDLDGDTGIDCDVRGDWTARKSGS